MLALKMEEDRAIDKAEKDKEIRSLLAVPGSSSWKKPSAGDTWVYLSETPVSSRTVR